MVRPRIMPILCHIDLRIPSFLEKPQESKNPRNKYCVTTQDYAVFHGSTREGGTGYRSCWLQGLTKNQLVSSL